MLWHAIVEINISSAGLKKMVSSKLFKGAFLPILSKRIIAVSFWHVCVCLESFFAISLWHRPTAGSYWSTGVKMMMGSVTKHRKSETCQESAVTLQPYACFCILMISGFQKGGFNKFFPKKVSELLLVSCDGFGTPASGSREFLHERLGGAFFAFRGPSCLSMTNSVVLAAVWPICFIFAGRAFQKKSNTKIFCKYFVKIRNEFNNLF